MFQNHGISIAIQLITAQAFCMIQKFKCKPCFHYVFFNPQLVLKFNKTEDFINCIKSHSGN